MQTLLDKISGYLTARNMAPGRFLTTMFGAMSVVIVLSIVMLSFPDTDASSYPHGTLFENACTAVWAIVAWPFMIMALIGGDTLLFYLWFPLLAVTGLFWAVVAGWLSTRRGPRRFNAPDAG